MAFLFEDDRRGGFVMGALDPFAADAEHARWPLWPVVLAFLAGAVVIAWPWLSGAQTFPWDAKAHFQPQIQFLAQSLARGESPFWTPYVFSGHAQIADPQSQIFAPPFLALSLASANPSLWAVDATVLAMVALGGIAMLAYFRDRGWHWGGALVAALAFGFGGSMAWRIQHFGQVLSLVYLMIAWWALARALDPARPGFGRRVAAGAVSGVVAGLMVLGRDQVALLGVYLLAGVVVWHWITASARGRAFVASLAPLLAGGIAGTLVVAVPVALTLLEAGQSNRPAIDLVGAERGSLHPAQLLTLLTPDVYSASNRSAEHWGPPSMTWQGLDLWLAQNVGVLYLGAVPLLLLVAGVVTGRLLDREARFLAVALVAMLLYALGRYTPAFAAMHALLPGVDLFRRPADATFLIGLLLCMQAGYMAHLLLNDRLAEPRPWQTALMVGIIGLMLAAALGLAVHFGKLDVAAMPLAVAVGLLWASALAIKGAAWLHPIRPLLAGLLAPAVMVADLAWSNGPSSSSALPTAHYDVLEPTTRSDTIALLKRKVAEGTSQTRRDRVELAGLGFHWPNASLTHGLENTLGYNPVRSGLYSRATGAEDHVGLPDQRKFSALFPSYKSRLADLLGLRWIATGVPVEQIDKTLKPGDLPLVARTADGFVYENPGALPRVLFASDARAADFEALLTDGRWPDVDPRRTVLLAPADMTAGDMRPGALPARRPGSARILSYRNTEVVIEVDSPDGGHLVLADVWHPWWRADVDGVPTAVLRANVIFRAVVVPEGRHIVRFLFQPYKGAAMALADQLASRPSLMPVPTAASTPARTPASSAPAR